MTRAPNLLVPSICVLFVITASLFAAAPARGQKRNNTLVVTGRPGEAIVIQRNGRAYVDLEMLAEMIDGAVSYQGSRMVLTIPSSSTGASEATPERTGQDTGFSSQFVNAAIETLGSMREWGSTLALTIKSGYPVGNAMAEYRGRAAKNFALAHAAASTEADRNALQLLTTEFNNMQAWSENLVKARNSMNAANLTMSEDALLNDPLSQAILRCWKFLGPMLASGRFEDDGSCR